MAGKSSASAGRISTGIIGASLFIIRSGFAFILPPRPQMRS